MNENLTQHVESTFGQLLQQLSALNEADLNKVPFEGSWTAAQVGDHLSKAYEILSVLNGRTTPAHRSIDAKLPGIKSVFLDFSTRFQSPAFIVPDSGPFRKAELLDRLVRQTESIVRYAQTQDLLPVCLDFELPSAGTLTRFELIGFQEIHTQRHLHQLKNIVARLNPN